MKKLVVCMAILTACFTGYGQDIPKLKITDIEKMMNSKEEGILVINFWATFCKPCVAEIPFFISITDKYKDSKVKLYLVSVDLPSAYPAKIASFAKQHKFNTNLAWLQETNADYFCPKIDASWSGSIPATLIINTGNGYRKFFEGEISATELEETLKEAIK